MEISAINTQLPTDWQLGLLLVAVFTLIAFLTRKIDGPGAFTGGILAACLWLGAGLWGFILLGAFFALGSLASIWKIKAKQQQGLAEANKGKRSVPHALSNGAVAGICGLLAWLFPASSGVLTAMLAGSLASATADTLSSELGNVLGTRYFNILSFRKEPKGLDGVISPEGTLAGTIGSLLMGLLYGIGFGWDWEVAWVTLAGIAGNVFDSVLGATLQRHRFLNNHTVNFANTLFAAFFTWLLIILFQLAG